MISLVSIGTKAIVASYSPHKPTSAFNFFCIFGDLIKFFAILCWVFRDPVDGYSHFLFTINFDALSLIWVWKITILVSIAVIAGISIWTSMVRSLYLERPDEKGMLCFVGTITLILFLFCLFPAMVVVEMLFGFSLSLASIFKRTWIMVIMEHLYSILHGICHNLHG